MGSNWNASHPPAPVERAARLATAYRARLRRYDPRAAVHDLIACERPAERSSAGDRSDDRTSRVELRASDDRRH